MNAIAAVVFDIGGVVQDSPLHVIARYERERGLEANAINRAVVAAGERGAWARLERGELTIQTFYALFEADCSAQGIAIDARRLMTRIAEASVPRPRMLEAIRRIRAGGRKVAALTNNWVADAPGRAARRGDDARAPRSALRRLRRVGGGQPPQARSAHLRAGLREARRGAGARRLPRRHRPQPQAGARARDGDDQGRRPGSGAARARGVAGARPRLLTAGPGLSAAVRSGGARRRAP